MNFIDSELIEFYSQNSEESRLTIGLGPLEFERNKELISRYLPSHQGCIADVGGGTGHYAAWLTSLGHDVILVDAIERHIQQAKRRSRKSRKRFDILLGDARTLPIESRSADLVILHGPLYHLQEKEDRLSAIREARRILKPGGTVLGVAITFAASTLAALLGGLIQQDDVYAMCKQELASGEHAPPITFPGMLPSCFYHRPSELRDEFSQIGFVDSELWAIEGLAWLHRDFFSHWSSPVSKKRMVDLLHVTEGDSDLLCLSPHIMLAATKE